MRAIRSLRPARIPAVHLRLALIELTFRAQTVTVLDCAQKTRVREELVIRFVVISLALVSCSTSFDCVTVVNLEFMFSLESLSRRRCVHVRGQRVGELLAFPFALSKTAISQAL